MSKLPTKRKAIDSYAKYAGLAAQLFGSLLVAAWIGQWLDQKMATSKPFFTAGLTLIVLSGMLYKIVKDLSNPPTSPDNDQ